MSIAGRLSAVVSLFLLVSACGGALPNTALRRHEANAHYKVNDSTPLVALMRERHIQPPDQSSGTPLLEQLQAELAKSDRPGRYKGITYDLTQGNMLGRDWIVQSPNDWGRKASDLKVGHSDALLSTINDLIVSARRSVDINLLQPAPDLRFLDTLRSAFGALARSGRPVSARILLGQFPPDNVDTKDFLAKVSAEAQGVSGSRLTISVAAMRSCTSFDDCDSFSWNHSKIISVDGREALVGGHNMWTRDYLLGDPVHDLSMRVSGPAAASASRFVDELWQYVCRNLKEDKAISVSSLPEGPCPATAKTAPTASAKGGVPIMAVGRLGAGITTDFANHSDLARDLMLGAAKHSIKIAQQDLGFTFARADVLFPESNLERIVAFLMRGEGDVYIVLSNAGSVGGSGFPYSNDVTLQTLARHLRQMVQGRFEARDPKSRYEIRKGPDPVNALLCEHVHLAPFRFGPDDKWPDHGTFATHMKLWMIDDRAFYIGSDNMYPVNLQEYGYIVDDRKAAGELLDSYWNPLWQWSQRAAVSGPGVENCIFREIIK